MAEKQSLDTDTVESALMKTRASVAAFARRESIVIFAGNTGAGKSTLINYLIGNKLVGTTVDDKIVVEKADDTYGPEIGVPSAIPSRYVSEKIHKYALWDTFGFSHDREYQDDICHAYGLAELYKHARWVKIAIVIDFATIEDESLYDLEILFEEVENTFGTYFKYGLRSTVIIITKIDHSPSDKPVTKKDFFELMKSTCKSHRRKIFIEYLISHQEHVGFFKKATLGPVTHDITVDVENVINNLQPESGFFLRKLPPNISKMSKEALLKVHYQLMFFEVFSKFKNFVVETLNSTLSDASCASGHGTTVDHFIHLFMKLNSLKHRIENVVKDQTASIDEKVDRLKLTNYEIKMYVEQNNLTETAKSVNFINRILESPKFQRFDTSLNAALFELIREIDKCMAKVKSEACRRCRIGCQCQRVEKKP